MGEREGELGSFSPFGVEILIQNLSQECLNGLRLQLLLTRMALCMVNVSKRWRLECLN